MCPYVGVDTRGFLPHLVFQNFKIFEFFEFFENFEIFEIFENVELKIIEFDLIELKNIMFVVA